MHKLFKFFLIIVLSFNLSGCGSSDGESSSGSAGGGSANASAEGTGGVGSRIHITTLDDLTIGITTVPSLIAPDNPVPPDTGYKIVDDDMTLSSLHADPACTSTFIGGDTVQVTGNLIVENDTTLFVDQPNWKLSVIGDLVVKGYVASKVLTSTLTPVVITVSGNAYVGGEITNSFAVDGTSGEAIELTANNIYMQGTISASGNDGVAAGGSSGSISLTATTAIHLAGATIEASGGLAKTSGTGGNGGLVTLTSPAIYGNSAVSISASGGAGITAGGHGSTVTFVPPPVAYGGSILSYGGFVESTGGDGLLAATGVSGGTISCAFEEVQLRGNLGIDGGNAVVNGGAGGNILLKYSNTSVLTPQISSDGGSAIGSTGPTTGGAGGLVTIEQETAGTGSLGVFTKSFNIEANGGIGGYKGGQGGELIVNCSGNLVFDGALSLNGGYGRDTGGSGGTGSLTSLEAITLSGSIYSTGGEGSNSIGGNGGTITVAQNGVLEIINNASLYANGGATEGYSTSDGGQAGQVNVLSTDGKITNNGVLSTTGGASYRQIGGNGGSLTVSSDSNTSGSGGDVANNGTLISDGGIGLTGGVGGDVLLAINPNNTGSAGLGNGSNSGTVSASGGPGNNDDGLGGASGTIRCYGTGSFSNTGTVKATYGDGSAGSAGSVFID